MFETDSKFETCADGYSDEVDSCDRAQGQEHGSEASYLGQLPNFAPHGTTADWNQETSRRRGFHLRPTRR
jgi:hypothetical protein